jgi:hypothetical protein
MPVRHLVCVVRSNLTARHRADESIDWNQAHALYEGASRETFLPLSISPSNYLRRLSGQISTCALLIIAFLASSSHQKSRVNSSRKKYLAMKIYKSDLF